MFQGEMIINCVINEFILHKDRFVLNSKVQGIRCINEN